MFPAACREPNPEVNVPLKRMAGVPAAQHSPSRAVRARKQTASSVQIPVNAHMRYQGPSRGEVEASSGIRRDLRGPQTLSLDLPGLAHPPTQMEEGWGPQYYEQLPQRPSFPDGSFASHFQEAGLPVQPMMRAPHQEQHSRRQFGSEIQLPRREADAHGGYYDKQGYAGNYQDLPFLPPTPTRGSTREAGIQCGVYARQSMDAHADRAKRAVRDARQGRQGHQSTMQHHGVPADADEALTPPPPEGSSRGRRSAMGISRLEDLQYPVRAVACSQSFPVELQASDRSSREKLSQALTAAVGKELDALDEAWGLGGVGPRRLEEDVAEILKAIASRAERRCVLQLLRHRLPEPAETAVHSEQVATLEERCARLEAEIAAADASLDQLDDFERDIDASSLGQGEDDRGLKEILTPYFEEAQRDAPGTSSSSSLRDGLEQWKQQLAISELWLRRTREELYDDQAQLEDRENSVTSKAFAHLLGGVANGHSALSQIP